MASPIINIGTRKSALALKQADWVLAALQALHPTHSFAVHGMATTGDKDQISSLYTMGKGLWTNELEARLLGGELDMVVHCLKDLPTVLPDGCSLGCVTAREDPRDVLVVKKSLVGKDGYACLKELPEGSVIGTSSVRRIAQLKARYPGLRFKDVRGNIDTRLGKLDDEQGDYAALVLAAAGLLRMGYGERITEYLDGEKGMLYAVGQGALAVEIRTGDERMVEILKGLEDRNVMMACAAERSVMRKLEGGCSVPIGVEASWVAEKRLKVTAQVVNLDGSQVVSSERTQEVDSEQDADLMGRKLADRLVELGAGKILEAINRSKEEAAKPA